MNLRKSITGLLTLVVVVVILNVNISVDCQCYMIIKQYYECKHLKMIRGEESGFVPNPNVANNTLDDSFYESTLSEMTVSEALQLVQLILKTARRTGAQCNRLCRCMKDTVRQENQEFYPAFFKGPKELSATTQILEEFISEASWAMKPEELIISEQYSYPSINLPSLVRFCINNDWNNVRSNFYYNSLYDISGSVDYEVSKIKYIHIYLKYSIYINAM